MFFDWGGVALGIMGLRYVWKVIEAQKYGLVEYKNANLGKIFKNQKKFGKSSLQIVTQNRLGNRQKKILNFIILPCDERKICSSFNGIEVFLIFMKNNQNKCIL